MLNATVVPVYLRMASLAADVRPWWFFLISSNFSNAAWLMWLISNWRIENSCVHANNTDFSLPFTCAFSKGRSVDIQLFILQTRICETWHRKTTARTQNLRAMVEMWYDDTSSAMDRLLFYFPRVSLSSLIPLFFVLRPIFFFIFSQYTLFLFRESFNQSF